MRIHRLCTAVIVGCLVAVFLTVPSTATAQQAAQPQVVAEPEHYHRWFLGPFVGANFGGAAGSDLNALDRSRLTFGAAAAYLTDGILGFEEDFAYSPTFYGSGGVARQGRVLTEMFNVVITDTHRGTLSPYVSGGIGVIARRLDGASAGSYVTRNSLGFDVGAGLNSYIGRHVGLRGDIRYLSNFAADDVSLSALSFSAGTFNFYRASIAVLVY